MKIKDRAQNAAKSPWAHLTPIILQLIVVLPGLLTVLVSQCNTDETNERLKKQNAELRKQNQALLRSGKAMGEQVKQLRDDAQRILNLFFYQMKQTDGRLSRLEEIQGWDVSSPLLDMLPRILDSATAVSAAETMYSDLAGGSSNIGPDPLAGDKAADDAGDAAGDKGAPDAAPMPRPKVPEEFELPQTKQTYEDFK